MPAPSMGGKTDEALLVVLTLLAMAILLNAATGVPAAVHYIGHDAVSATMAKGGAIVEDPGLRILANRREAGEAEFHEKTNHLFIIVEGEATFRIQASYKSRQGVSLLVDREGSRSLQAKRRRVRGMRRGVFSSP